MTLAAVMYAKDLDRLVAFYTALGLTVDEAQRGDYAVLMGPRVELSIVQIPEHIASQIEISNPPQARSRTPIKLVFFVPSIDGALEAARLHGGRVDDGSKRWQFRGHTVQDAIDPEGNLFQLRQPLSDRVSGQRPAD
jgi:catechol 2,3-dioxygenase-like lactoylglutathione lyase family enzyme